MVSGCIHDDEFPERLLGSDVPERSPVEKGVGEAGEEDALGVDVSLPALPKGREDVAFPFHLHLRLKRCHLLINAEEGTQLGDDRNDVPQPDEDQTDRYA